MLSLKELEAAVADGSIDTIVVAFTDMQGRLMGKRVHGEHFLSENLAESGVEACDYLMALDMEMDPVPGYAMANWDLGYGDFVLKPDVGTLRVIPWLEATAMVLCDVASHDGSDIAASPRQVLKKQVERAREMGFEPMIGTELEFYLLKETYAEAHAKGYENLTPSVPYVLDYHVLATTYDEPFIRQIRNGMHAAGIPVEYSKGEAWPGQHEINFRYADAVEAADRHTIYKNGAKELAHLNGCSLTFMAKPREDWIGNSCHVHSSLWADGKNAFADESPFVQELPRRAHRRAARAGRLPRADDQLVQALRRRIVGADDARLGPRQPHLRLPHRRARAVAALGDADPRRGRQSPTCAVAALLAAGLNGIENELELPPPLEGNAYESDAPRFPHSLRRGDRGARVGDDGARDSRRRRGRPLPDVREDRAAALRLGGHGLRAAPHVRARLARASAPASTPWSNRHTVGTPL